MPYVAKRNYRRGGTLVPRGTPVPEVETVPLAVLDRLLRTECIERVEALPVLATKKEEPIRGRPPIQ